MNTYSEYWAAKRRKITKDIGSRVLWPLEQKIARASTVSDEAVLPRREFSWLRTLEDNSTVLRQELDEVLRQRERLQRFQDISPDQRSISRDDRWRTYFFSGFGHRGQDSAMRCPHTTRLLERIPGLVTAFYSILAPGAHIPRHRGVFKGLVRAHLALKVPSPVNACRMEIEGQTLYWREGEAFVFDDTRPHEVWNDSEDERVVLLIDVVRPLRGTMQAVNHALLKAIALSPYVTEGVRNVRKWELAMRA